MLFMPCKILLSDKSNAAAAAATTAAATVCFNTLWEGRGGCISRHFTSDTRPVPCKLPIVPPKSRTKRQPMCQFVLKMPDKVKQRLSEIKKRKRKETCPQRPTIPSSTGCRQKLPNEEQLSVRVEAGTIQKPVWYDGMDPGVRHILVRCNKDSAFVALVKSGSSTCPNWSVQFRNECRFLLFPLSFSQVRKAAAT